MRDPDAVTLLGGGPWREAELRAALARAPRLICADGGANDLARRCPDLAPEMIVGDLDSLRDRDIWSERLGTGLVHVTEQDGTDFDKCLATVRAGLFIAVGFSGGRVDHQLSVLNSLVREHRPVLVLGDDDLVFAAPGGGEEIVLEIGAGCRLSVFPLRPVRGQSEGLRWPLKGLDLRPGGGISTSNRADTDTVRLGFETRGALVILPSACLGAALAAFAGRE